MKAKQLIIIALALTVCLVLLSGCSSILDEIQKEKNQTDLDNLRSVIAEAYINVHSDPTFVNTATEDCAMLVPEKYYTYVESVQGHGPIYVYITVDGGVVAYFGEPYRDCHYYADVVGVRTTLPQFKDQY